MKALNLVPFYPKILDIPKDEPCFVVGTIYLDMPLKPSIFDELSTEFSIVPQPIRTNYFSDQDKITLEDFTGRIILTGDLIQGQKLVTGVVVAAKGIETENGFIVQDLLFPVLPPQSPLPPLTEKPKYIALISGLEVDRPNNNLLSLRLMADFLTGSLGQNPGVAESIVRVIVAGNSFHSVPFLSNLHDVHLVLTLEEKT